MDSSSSSAAASSPLTPRRTSRNVARVNYAEASDELESVGSGRGRSRVWGGSGSGRKRQRDGSIAASPSPSPSPSSKPRTPMSLVKKIQRATLNSGSKRTGDDDENAIGSARKGSKAKAALDFGSAHKIKEENKDAPSAAYVNRFLIACEEICARDPSALRTFHTALIPLLPIDHKQLMGIRETMQKAFGKKGKRIVERIENQLHALGPHGAPNPSFVHKTARSPLLSTCSSCKFDQCLFTTVCTNCKKTCSHTLGRTNAKALLTPHPYLDWRLAVVKQRELDAFSQSNPTSTSKPTTPSSSRKKKVKNDEDKDADATNETSSDSSQSNTSAPAASPVKRQRTSSTSAASPSPSPSPSVSPSASPSTPRGKQARSALPVTPSTPSVSHSDAALDSVPHPDGAWIEKAREELTIRAIEYIRICVARAKKHEFDFHAGDIIFLLRNAIFKGHGEVAKHARSVVSEMLERWDRSNLTIISDNSEPAHILVYTECLHAKHEMEWHPAAELAELVRRVRSALTQHCAEDILRFDASLFTDSLPVQAYCHPCGEFHAGSKGICPNPNCGGLLRAEHDFEYLCESLVWTSVFRELGIAPVVTADAAVNFEHVLALMKFIRPYRSLEERGANSYKLQCYFITHLTFVLTKWGACPLLPRDLFLEEYLFLASNMDVVIRWKDPELVGEFLAALHILHTPPTHPAMQKGYHYLLCNEKRGKMRGNWVPAGATFYQRYHAAYCGIIGLADFQYDRNEKFDPNLVHFFE